MITVCACDDTLAAESGVRSGALRGLRAGKASRSVRSVPRFSNPRAPMLAQYLCTPGLRDACPQGLSWADQSGLASTRRTNGLSYREMLRRQLEEVIVLYIHRRVALVVAMASVLRPT